MLLALSLSRSLALLPPPLARLTYSGPAIWHRRWLATIPWPPGERRGLGRSVRGEGVRERGGVVVARPGPFPPSSIVLSFLGLMTSRSAFPHNCTKPAASVKIYPGRWLQPRYFYRLQHCAFNDNGSNGTCIQFRISLHPFRSQSQHRVLKSPLPSSASQSGHAVFLSTRTAPDLNLK